jgi:hypothetical protein
MKRLSILFIIAIITIFVVSCGTSKRSTGCKSTQGMSGY